MQPPHLLRQANPTAAGKRLSAATYLERWGPRLFPAYFGPLLHPFFTALLPLDADERVAAVLAAFPQLHVIMQAPQLQRAGRMLPPAVTLLARLWLRSMWQVESARCQKSLCNPLGGWSSMKNTERLA